MITSVPIREWDPPPAPPLPRRPELRRSYAVPVAIGTAAVLALGALVAVGATLSRYSTGDHWGILDDPAVVQVADSACVRMARHIHAGAPSPVSSPAASAAAMRTQDAAIEVMVAKVRAVGDESLRADNPAVQWLADWESLASAREAYADELARGGQPRLAILEVDGVPVTERMDQVGLDAECAVARELAHPPSVEP